MSSVTPTTPSPTAAPATAGRTGPPWSRLYLQPAFVAAVVILGVAAVGLNAATQALQVHFKKLPVPLRQKLDSPADGVPSTLGPWVKVSEQVSLNPDIQHALGTDQFVFRQYADTRVVAPERIAELAGKDEKTQEALLAKIASEHPNAVLSFAVTYYTGLADRVTHVPDRCMVAGGYSPVNPQTIDDARATFAMPGGETRRVPFRFITFEDQTGRGQLPTRVAYFFNCNGDYTDDHSVVRFKLQNLFERHGYYAKVELMVRDFRRTGVDAREREDARAMEAMRDLIGHALPDVERCLPDWQAVKASASASK